MPNRIQRRSDLAPSIGRSNLALRPRNSTVVYDSAWQHVATQRRHMDCHLCQLCLAEDRLTPSTDVDHVIPIHVRPDWRLELDNTQVICRPHHRKKTAADSRRYGSSLVTKLTATQQEARRQAQQLVDPPRTPQGGPVETVDVLLKTVASPARVSPRIWTAGE